MAGTTTFDNDILKLIFTATGIANIADNAASSPATTYYLSLHTASPGKSGSQTSSETSYTGYARIAVNRNSGGWTVTGSSATNAAEIDFARCLGGAQDLTYVGVGTASTGTGKLILYNPLGSTLSLAAGAAPLFDAGALTFTCD